MSSVKLCLSSPSPQPLRPEGGNVTKCAPSTRFLQQRNKKVPPPRGQRLGGARVVQHEVEQRTTCEYCFRNIVTTPSQFSVCNSPLTHSLLPPLLQHVLCLDCHPFGLFLSPMSPGLSVKLSLDILSATCRVTSVNRNHFMETDFGDWRDTPQPQTGGHPVAEHLFFV